MPVQTRIKTTDDIINGIATVGSGVSKPQTFDRSGSQHFPSGDGLLLFQTLDKRYKYHGGANGSGNWEH